MNDSSTTNTIVINPILILTIIHSNYNSNNNEY
jgi:hypothetical protein